MSTDRTSSTLVLEGVAAVDLMNRYPARLRLRMRIGQTHMISPPGDPGFSIRDPGQLCKYIGSIHYELAPKFGKNLSDPLIQL